MITRRELLQRGATAAAMGALVPGRAGAETPKRGGTQYLTEIYSPVVIFVWDGALKNYGPNLGYDYAGRPVAAWLDR